METGKTGKYFKYAIGEIILVVLGILIALQINNWNENRKLNEQREELISNLIKDFTAANENIDLAIKKREVELDRMENFYGFIKNEKQIIALDSLRIMARVFYSEENFKPNISSYNEAVSNGDLKLLKNRLLTKHIDVFFEAIDSYRQIFNFGGESYYHGPVWELRKSLGSLQPILLSEKSLKGLPHKNLSYDEFVAIMNEPLVTATFENGYNIKRNLTNHLKTMKSSCDSIISTLNNLKNN
jgi:hypothetical protein